MKATIKQDGTLVIFAENDIEAYALTQWMSGTVNNAIAIETSHQGTKMTIGKNDTAEEDPADIRLK